MIRVEERQIAAGGELARGTALHVTTWQPDSPQAALVIVHGLGEHGGRYDQLARRLADKQVAVLAPDLPGHGRSPGRRGHVRRWSDLLDVVSSAWHEAQDCSGGGPLFLMGHSMGGNVAACWALQRPRAAAGVILSAPAVGRLIIGWPTALASQVLSWLWPGLSLPTGLDPAGLSSDEAEVQAYRDDPLVHSWGTPQMAAELMRSAAFCLQHADRWQAPPLLLLHGDADPICDISQSREFFERVPLDDKQMIVYAGTRHEPLHDRERERVTEDIVSWVVARMPHTNKPRLQE